MPLHDTSYQHWDGAHLGLWRRRLAIARNGLTAALRNRWLRHVLLLCWSAALAMAGALFLIGQLLVSDSMVVKWAANFGATPQLFAQTLTSWLVEHPEISVHTTQNALLYFFCTWLLRAGIFILGMAIPVLITRDLASNAITIYSSKAVSLGDYVLGKFSAAFGLLALAWLGPVCAAWFLGNLLAPDWRFFWHSRAALGNALAFVLCGMVVLSVLALGVSACSSREKTSTTVWYVWWIFGGVVAPIAAQTQPWLRHLSFNYNLEQLALAVFRLGENLNAARDNIPVFGNMLRNTRPQTLVELSTPATSGAVVWLLGMLVLAALVVRKRVKPQ
jgi:ABC-2 type transport system permease protein